MTLAPVAQKSLPEVVEDQLLDYVRAAGLGVGSPLPGEMDLARRLGVSRGVVREAVSRLRMLGIIHSRRNRGAVLCLPDPFLGLERILAMPLLDREAERDLMELRVVQEMGITDLFWNRKTPDDVAFLARVGKELDTSPGFPTVTPRTKELEKVFHGRVFAVAGNRFATRMQALLDCFYDLEDLHRRTPPLKRPDLPDHGKLVTLMTSGSRDQFRGAMYEHLRVYLDLLEIERAAEPHDHAG
jgi:DNA-binding FadR family transcriptional regulator